MSVVINTNFAATLAANNLAASSDLLQRSLNRLSSGSKIVNPADDAGGMAVSTKLSAAARRQGAAASNLGNAVSYLQAQDGVMKTVGKVLERMGELKTLANDPTKNASDIANYNEEFSALQAQITSMAGEKFNGVSLFGSSTLSVDATADAGGSTIAIGGADLLGTVSAPAFSPFTDTFNNLSSWTNNSTGDNTSTTSSNYLTLKTLNPGSTGDASVTSNDSFSGPFELTLDFTSNGPFQVQVGGTTVLDYPGDVSTHSLRLVVDASGNFSSYVDGASTAHDAGSGISGSNQITLKHLRQPATSANVHIQNFSIQSISDSGTNTADVANATSLANLDLSTITEALEDVATFRADNGAQQSRLGFASELLSVNKANLEAANSRITDVDVAVESTQLARYNVLVQAGTAMLGQANQSAQNALRLISG
jgi:flagellin-like hook-associated protein FlgL